MWEYDCWNSKTGEEEIIFGHGYKDALSRAGISEEYASENLYCYHYEYVD